MVRGVRGWRITLHILGSASGVPTQQRFNTSLAFKISGNVYLFDAGEPCSSLLIRNKVDYGKIRCIFISHMHSDHVSGIFQLIQTLQLLSVTKRPQISGKVIELFVPEEAIEAIRKMFDALYLMPETLPFLLRIFPIKETYFYKDDHIRVRAIANAHLRKGYKRILQDTQEKYHNDFQSYSFLIKAEEKRIVYSGDISNIAELNEFIDNIDLLILELAHIVPREMLKFLSKRDIPKVVLMHLHPRFDDPDNDELGQLRTQIKNYMPNRVIIAKDGLSIKL